MSKAKASICVMIATTVTVMTLFFLPKPDRQTFTTTTVTAESLKITCMLEGRAVYSGRQLLLSPVSGTVAQCYAMSGDRVNAGELIIRMDSQADEEALAVLESYSYQLTQATVTLGGNLPAADLWLTQQQQRASLAASIRLKQIRANAGGIVENLYVQPGEYVAAGTLLGQIRGETISVSAVWTGESSITPATGLQAYWCEDDGTPIHPMTLEAVALTSDQNGYLLTFAFENNGKPVPAEGERAPVLLMLEELPATTLIPLNAMDDEGRIWIVENGHAYPVEPETGLADQHNIQVSNLQPGTRVILEPDQTILMENGRVRNGADV